MINGQNVISKKTLNLEIFHRKVTIYFVDKHFEIDGYRFDNQISGYVTRNFEIYLLAKGSRGVWVHEIIHMADLIFDSLEPHQLPLAASTEVRAYLGEWLYGEIEKLEQKLDRSIKSRRRNEKR